MSALREALEAMLYDITPDGYSSGAAVSRARAALAEPDPAQEWEATPDDMREWFLLLLKLNSHGAMTPAVENCWRAAIKALGGKP